MAIFGFKLNLPEEVLNHNLTIAPGFTYPPQEFYSLVEQHIGACKVPGLEVSRVEHSEGGPLSDKRLYLRFIRERLSFEACAAPFGTEYFFSCRTIYSPVQVKLWHLLAAVLIPGLLFLALMRPLGVTYAGIATTTFFIALAQVLHNTSAMNLDDLDTLILKIPVLSPIYERWFRKDTYHRQDTRLVYLELIPRIIQQVVDEITASKGAKLVNTFERAPILGELYKRKEKSP